jgi:hypothetical protein
MDSTTVGIIGALATALAGLGGWFSKQGVDAWLKLRADKREDVKLEDAREDVLQDKEDKTLRYIIGIQQGELTSLRAEVKEMQGNHRAELKTLHDQHNDCEKRHAELATELRVRMEFMSARVGKVEAAAGTDPKLIVEMHDSEAITKAVNEEIKPAIRTAVHDLRDDINAVGLKAQLRQAESDHVDPE